MVTSNVLLSTAHGVQCTKTKSSKWVSQWRDTGLQWISNYKTYVKSKAACEQNDLGPWAEESYTRTYTATVLKYLGTATKVIIERVPIQNLDGYPGSFKKNRQL